MAAFTFENFLSGAYTGLPIDKFRALGLNTEDYDEQRWEMLVKCVDSGLMQFSCSRDEALVLLWNEEELPKDDDDEVPYEVPCWTPDTDATVIDDVSEWLAEKTSVRDTVVVCSDYDAVSETPVEVLSVELEEDSEEDTIADVCLDARRKSFRDYFTIVEEEFVEEDPLISLNDGNVCPVRTHEVTSLEKPVMLDVGRRCDRVNLESLQGAINMNLPSHAYFDDTWHQYFVEGSKLDVDFDNIRLRQSEVFCDRDLDRYYQPELFAGASSRRIGTQKEALVAIRKRNADVPELADSVDVERLSESVAKKFLSSYVCDLKPVVGVMEKMRAYHQKWGDKIDPMFLLKEHNLQRYEHMIKTDVKPTVAHSMHVERAIPATITFHGKSICAGFSPSFTALFDEFQKSLDERVVIPSGPISTIEMDFDIRNKYYLEVDLSKFDKSQGLLHLEFQRKILCKIGLPAHLANWWCDFHYKSFISDPRAKVSFNCSFQRRTGDAFTFFGNTLVTMAMFSFCYDTRQFEKMLFAGDDSLAISSSPIVGCSDYFVSLFNMEAKIMDPGVPYICSKFLVSDELGRCFSAPDPIREFQRLGKKKISADNDDALFEQYVGFKDRMSHMRNFSEYEIQQLKIFFNLKYKQSGEVIEDYMGACMFYSDNFKNFKTLFTKTCAPLVAALNKRVKDKPFRLPPSL
ncbi:putative 2a protein [Pelargonium zonate spot virus]|uniref:RNA-directed RNA polymerase 2a n=1 Tax=Pelargonium zonate spot virus (isolate Tomato/Italy/1982) TaxID=650488 RepID=RDRP_PZSVT|nr:putative 2a protein [Pelargonium zonate spot virus]Q9DUT2.1 RecName: Full=RNA-directed RNA polymerase 2a; Short=protein 2a [Pelargonium zonate spot virus isolate tomato]CAC08527.1 putative 2a protein [Pelargonium zonate spot virus]